MMNQVSMQQSIIRSSNPSWGSYRVSGDYQNIISSSERFDRRHPAFRRRKLMM